MYTLDYVTTVPLYRFQQNEVRRQIYIYRQIYVQIVNIYNIYIYTHKYMCAHLRIAIPPAAL